MRAILNLLGIRWAETPRLALATAISFLVIFGVSLGRAGRDALFYVNVGEDWLPLMFVFNAIVSIFISSFWGGFMDRHSVDALYKRAVPVFAGVTVLMFLISVFFQRVPGFPFKQWVFFGTQFILTEAVAVLLIVATANFINDRAMFDVGAIKRLAPYYVSGGHVGGMVAGATALYWGDAIGVRWFFLIWTASLALVFGLALVVSWKYYRVQFQVSAPSAHEEPGFFADLQMLWGNRYLRLFLGITVCNFMLGSSYEFLLAKEASEVVGGNPDELAAYLGKVYLYGGLAALVVQLVVLRGLIQRFGVGLVNLGAPVLLLFAALGLFVRIDVGTAIAARAAFFLAENGFNQTLIRFVYNVVERAKRMRAESFIEVNVINGAAAIAGVLLFVVFTVAGVDLVYLGFLVVILASVMLWWTWQFRREYGAQAQNTYLSLSQVERGRLFDDVFDGTAADSERIIDFIDRVNEPETIVEAIRQVTRRREARRYQRFIYRRLNDPDPGIQVAAIKALGAVGQPEDAKLLEGLLEEKDPHILIGVLRAYSELSGETVSVEQFGKFLNSDDPIVVSAAIAQLWTWGGVDVVHTMAEKLRQLKASDRREDRLILVRTLGELGQKAIGDLVELLEGDDVEIRSLALEVLGGVQNRQVLSHALHALLDPAVRRSARRALLTLSDSFGPEILREFGSTEQDLRIRTQLASVLQDMAVGGDSAGRGFGAVTDVLLTTIEDEDHTLREATVAAIAHRSLERLSPPIPWQTLENAANRAVDDYLRLWNAIGVMERASARDPKARLLLARTEIKHLLDRKVQTTRNLLTCAFPEGGVPQAFAQLARPRDRAGAIEVLENVVPRRVFQLIRPVIENDHRDQELKRRTDISRNADEVILFLLKQDDGQHLALSIWFGLRSVASALGRRITELLEQNFRQEREDPMDLLSVYERAESMRETDLLQDLPMGQLVQMAREADEAVYDSGETIYESGQDPDCLFILTRGKVSVLREDTDTNTRQVVRTFEATTTFGEVSLVKHGPVGETVRADIASSCLLIGTEQFSRLLQSHSALYQELVLQLAARLAEAESSILHFASLGDRITNSLKGILEPRLAPLEGLQDLKTMLQKLIDSRVVVQIEGKTRLEPLP